MGGLSEGTPIAWTTPSGNRYIGWVLRDNPECTRDAVTAVTPLGAVWSVPAPEQPTDEEHHQLLEHQWAADDKGRTP